jgi:HSP20 family protein
LFLFDELKGLDWSPQADVYRTPTGWVVVLDLAGVSPDEVTVEATRSELRVAGVRRDRFVKRGFLQHSMEISYSRFERSLRLPCKAEDCRMRTEYVDGMLVITLDEEEES